MASCAFCHNPKSKMSLRGASKWSGKLRYKCNKCGRTEHREVKTPKNK